MRRGWMGWGGDGDDGLFVKCEEDLFFRFS